jgi:hypothetical protein
MSTKISACSSTSTTNLMHRQVISIDSHSQTTANDDHDDEDYANYEEINLQKPSISMSENKIRKSDQTTLCRINHYSIACWTKPAYLLTN